MPTLANTFLNIMSILEYGSLKIKLLYSVVLAGLLSPIPYLIESLKYYFVIDVAFTKLIAWLIIFDLIFGIWKHLKIKNFSFKLMMYGLLIKITVSYFAMMVFNGFGTIEGISHLDVKIYILLVGKLTNFFYVAGSIFNNMYIITSGRFPPVGWMKRMKRFNETLDISIFKDTPIEEILPKETEKENELTQDEITSK